MRQRNNTGIRKKMHVEDPSLSSLREARNYFGKKKLPKRLRHQGFLGGLPSKYQPGATELNCGDRTRTGVFSVLWPQPKEVVVVGNSHSVITCVCEGEGCDIQCDYIQSSLRVVQRPLHGRFVHQHQEGHRRHVFEEERMMILL